MIGARLRNTTAAGALLLMTSTATAFGAGPLTKCPPDAVISGTVCIDKYEASVWRVPNATGANKNLVKKIRKGKATPADLAKGGATNLDAYYEPCATRGQNCANDIFALSLPGVLPSTRITWFQAQAACKNARKRLPSNAEWQAAVIGTPDPGPDDGTTDCNTNSTHELAPTGSRSSCVSADGAFDMVGNLVEWVADWVPRPTACGAWDVLVSPTDDAQCFSGGASDGEPGALVRGGGYGDGPGAGPLAIAGIGTTPSLVDGVFGFRCVR